MLRRALKGGALAGSLGVVAFGSAELSKTDEERIADNLKTTFRSDAHGSARTVDRAPGDQLLREYLVESDRPSPVVLVVGPPGVGKSFAVARALEARPGVIRVRYSTTPSLLRRRLIGSPAQARVGPRRGLPRRHRRRRSAACGTQSTVTVSRTHEFSLFEPK